jgi:hypothetical protein
MVLASFAAGGQLSRSELDRITLAQAQRLPSAEDPLASYTTKASLIYTPHNPSGFSDRMLRQLCTDRNLPPPEGVTTWERVGSQQCAKELLDWRNRHNK